MGPASRPSLERFAASAGSIPGVVIEGCGLAGIREPVLPRLRPASLMLGMHFLSLLLSLFTCHLWI